MNTRSSRNWPFRISSRNYHISLRSATSGLRPVMSDLRSSTSGLLSSTSSQSSITSSWRSTNSGRRSATSGRQSPTSSRPSSTSSRKSEMFPLPFLSDISGDIGDILDLNVDPPVCIRPSSISDDSGQNLPVVVDHPPFQSEINAGSMERDINPEPLAADAQHDRRPKKRRKSDVRVHSEANMTNAVLKTVSGAVRKFDPNRLPRLPGKFQKLSKWDTRTLDASKTVLFELVGTSVSLPVYTLS
eukprot:51395_1